jgi:hypothetical protein
VGIPGLKPVPFVGTILVYSQVSALWAPSFAFYENKTGLFFENFYYNRFIVWGDSL